jgi:signal transduction histidine kinase
MDVNRPVVTEGASESRLRGSLFRKYVSLFVAVVSIALLANGLPQVFLAYQEHRDSLIRIQREQAVAAADKISQFLSEIENQIGWTTQLSWTSGTLDQRRFDALRLLRQVPAITELAEIDPTGHEQLRVSRIAMDVVGSGVDLATTPKFTEAVAHKIYYGPVYFRRDSEPYMTIAMAGGRKDSGVSIAEVNLKFIWDVVSRIKVGENGLAYVIDASNRLIAHPDISLVLRDSDLSNLPQVLAARESGIAPSAQYVVEAKNIEGKPVLTANAPVKPLGWLVFVDLPRDEAYAPLYASIKRSGLLMLAALSLAGLAGTLLARRMVVPIQALRTGAARIGSGDLDQRITVNTRDELESLADQFNDMAGRLKDSYTDLERKVETRTRELARSVEELRALGEVGQAVNSTLDLQTVLETIVVKAVQLSGTEAGTIYVFDELRQEFQLRANHGLDEVTIAAIRTEHFGATDTLIGKATSQRIPLQVADVQERARSGGIPDVIIRAGYRALLIVPLLRPDKIIGALVVRRREPGQFSPSSVNLLETFADQSVMAIQNARLFQEIEEKGRELQIASRHKSQFLANMSHELRTPLNAILGYTELILDNIYGEVPERVHGVLDRVQSNGRHLLGLINDVLDLSKIEAGQLTLSLTDYSLESVVMTVFTALESLATEKHLALKVDIQPGLPIGYGDERRLAQVLLNLVGNAIKFTDEGEVSIKASVVDGTFTVEVSDTGPGISQRNQRKIFEEFQQADISSTRAKGGTGLGLSIARKIIEMHGGRLWVESVLGEGSTFLFSVPTTVERQAS